MALSVLVRARKARAASVATFVVTAVASLVLAGCATDPGGGLASDVPVPDDVPPGTTLSLAVKTTKVQLDASGRVGELAFAVSDWPTVSAGPDVIQGFRGDAIDLATNAAVPPIQAGATGFDAKIVAVREKDKPQYQLATSPSSGVESLDDLRGKRLAVSPGQAQGVVVLRTLKSLGIGFDDVQIVELPSTQFLTALQSGQVDVAPLSEPTLTKYLDQYGPEGARALTTPEVDALTVLWAPVSVLEDPAKAAAIKSFIPLWAQSEVWAWENPDEWIRAYYVDSEGVSFEDGKRIVDSVGQEPRFPSSWDYAIQWTQETADILAEGGWFSEVDAEVLFDRRFETIASESVSDSYRVGESS